MNKQNDEVYTARSADVTIEIEITNALSTRVAAEEDS
jgi:hypothetical protein